MPDDLELPKPRNNPAFDPARARRAARSRNRPGEQCRAEPGRYRPQVDLRRCEGKADCLAVCPYGVFELRPLTAEEGARLGPLVRLKLWVHGSRIADTPRADACQACGLCVTACPERAITLVREDGEP